MQLEEWAKAIADGTSKCDRLDPPWGVLPEKVLTTTPWPLRLRIRGLDKLFSLPDLERCAYLQVRSELIFGGQVIESKLSKRMKRNAALRFDDEWLFFSKFASDMAFSTRVAFTLVGLDAIAPNKEDRKNTQLDDDDETATLQTKSSSMGLATEPGNLVASGTKKMPFWRRLAGSTAPTIASPEKATMMMMDATTDAPVVLKDIELAGTSFSIWGPDLLLKSGVVSLGMWPGRVCFFLLVKIYITSVLTRVFFCWL